MSLRPLDPKAEAIRGAWQREVDTAARTILTSGYGSHAQADAQALIMRRAEEHGADVIAWAVHCSADAAAKEVDPAGLVDLIEGALLAKPAGEQVAFLAGVIEGLAAMLAKKAGAP